MIFHSEQELTDFAEHLGSSLKSQKLPLCLELVGDVGAGKTTFTKALARGLGITEPVTSPSFTISKRYEWSACQNRATHREATSVTKNELIHYDFYRLTDPGLMRDDLAESLKNPHALVVLEWANSVQGILPKNHQTITFKVLKDGSRKLIFDDSVIWNDSCSEISPNPQDPTVKTTTSSRNEYRMAPGGVPTERCSFDDRGPRTRTNSELESSTTQKTLDRKRASEDARPQALEACQVKTFDRKRAQRTRTNSELESSVPSTASEPFSLYLDTSDFTAKIKLTDKTGQTFEYTDALGREMAEKLLETLENHLKDHGATFRDLKKITFYSGPGSFTGLRIGACLVNTLSHELHIPLYDHKGTRRQIILPDYGRPANISKPKK